VDAAAADPVVLPESDFDDYDVNDLLVDIVKLCPRHCWLAVSTERYGPLFTLARYLRMPFPVLKRVLGDEWGHYIDMGNLAQRAGCGNSLGSRGQNHVWLWIDPTGAKAYERPGECAVARASRATRPARSIHPARPSDVIRAFPHLTQPYQTRTVSPSRRAHPPHGPTKPGRLGRPHNRGAAGVARRVHHERGRAIRRCNRARRRMDLVRPAPAARPQHGEPHKSSRPSPTPKEERCQV